MHRIPPTDRPAKIKHPEPPDDMATGSAPAADADAVSCDRCSGPMFRMRAVYWCTNCGYKTDCCGS